MSLLNIVIGYVQLGVGPRDESDDVARLHAMGAHVVRVEERLDGEGLFKPRLNAICDFVGPGDELIAPDIGHLGEHADAVHDVVRRIGAQGGEVRVLDPDMRLVNEGAAPEAARPETTDTCEAVRVLDSRTIIALRAHGFGPTQIARKLGVSRMTVWRRMAKLEAQ